ncbi:cadherin domain-containing protein [Aquidulcibacter paucihalophilus]|nr:cadherin domain-containing protein [Aquidulcibacter paucihalophilus]
MAIRNTYTKPGLVEPGPRARSASALQVFDIDRVEGADHLLDETVTSAPRPLTAEVLPPAPEGTAPLRPVDQISPPVLDAPRPVSAGNDTASAVEDGPAVVISVLNNDVGAAAVARINGAAVTAGSIITLPSGARVIVNSDGTLSYEVGTAFQSLGAGQTAQDSFTYAAGDGGGSPLAPEGVFNAASINGTNGFVIHGAAAGDRSGYSVAGIGDVNGDGRDDLLIGALSADPTGRTDAGASYVVYGRQGGFGASLDLANLTAAQGFALTGVNAFDFSGASVQAAGDVNGDGLADFLIGAPWGEAAQGSNAGETYLVFGRAGGFGAGLDLSTLNGTTGVTFRGGAAGDGLGFAVSSAGDINGDGFDDLILGAREANGGAEADAGASYVVFGRAGGFAAELDVAGLTGANGFAILGADASDRSGYSVAAAGDVNGDGIDDLIIGAPQGDPGGRANAGEAFVVFGRVGGFGATLDLGALGGADGFTISGVDAGDHAGWSVASAGDLNGDGRADLVIGALYADPAGRENAGETYVVFGRAGGFGANLDLSSMPAAMGFTITGTAALNLTGHSVASAGDVNGDGIDDLLIGALYADGTGGADAGETYVVFGRTTGFGNVLDLASLNGQTGFLIGGVAAGDFTGQSVSAAGDVNGDGFDDLIIGAPHADPSGRVNAGSSYVLFGAANVTRLTNDATVTVTVTGTNDGPVITSNGGGATGGYTIVENTTGPNTVTAFDPDAGSNLTWSIIGGADAALFAINGAGVLSLINPANFEAPADQNADNIYQVIIQVSDGTLTDTQTLNVTVTNANEAPVIFSNGGGAVGTYTIVENTPGANPIGANDPDAGANLTYSIIGGADAARFTMNNGVLSLINPPDFEAPTDQNGDNVYEVIVQVSDGTLTDTQTINLTVTNANEAPVITSGGAGPSTVITGVENSTTVTTLVAADPDAGANLTWSIITGRDGARFAINPTTGVLTFVAAPDFEAPTDQNADGVYEVDVQVSDGQGGTDVQTVFVNVGNANEAPVITSNGGGATGGYTIFENTLGPNTVSASDPDAGSNLTYSIIGGADATLFTMNGAGVLSLINPPNFEAPTDQNGDNVYEVIVQASDGTLTDTQTISLTVINANEAPVITSNGGGAVGGYTISENTTGPTTITAFDPDAGANLTYTIVGGADAGLFGISVAGVLSLINPPDFEAPADQNGDNVYQVVVQVSDGTLTDTQTINLTVTNANEAPVITSDGGGTNGTVSVAEGSRSVTTVSAIDPDAGATLTYAIVGGADAALFSINPATGAVGFITPPDFENPLDAGGDNNYDIVVQASDGVNSDTQNLRVTVTDVAENTLSLTDVVGTVASNEGDPAVQIDADVTFVDSGVGYGGGNLSITGLNPTDLISIRHVGIGSGQIGIEFGVVSFEGVDIGTVASPPPTGAYVINFNSSATRAAIEALVEALLFQSTSDIPVSTHALTLQITNAASETSAPVTVAVQFTADILNGSAGNDILSGLRGNDVINGFDGIDTLSGGAGDDRIFGGLGNDDLDGGDADDVLEGGQGLDTLRGGDGRDVLRGDEADDTLFGETSDDFLQGGDGNDTLDGGSEDDRLLGDTGIDTLLGGDGFDRLSGGDGDDFLFAGNGEDILTGGIGIDDIQGEDGDDQLSGDGGDDRIDGGAGFDTAIFKGPLTSYTIQLITAGVVRVVGPDGDDLVLNCEFLQFDDQTVNLVFANNEPPRITSDGGGAEIGIDVDEGQTTVTTIVATDVNLNTVTYSIAGGTDAAMFTIDPATGVLTFVTAPDFEAPTDLGRDNTYDVIVSASDGQLRDLQAVTVTVLDIAGGATPSTKGGGPEICYGPDDVDGGEAGSPQVLPGLFDKADTPPVLDDLGDLREMPDIFPQQDPFDLSPFRLTDTLPHEPPPFIVRDDGFS